MTHPFSITLVPVLPAWLIAALAAALLALLGHGSMLLLRKKVPRNWVAILGILRAAIVVVLVLGLLQPIVSYSRTVERLPDLLLLVDTSRSMSARSGPGATTRLEEALAAIRKGGLLSELKKRYEVRWFAFDRSAYPLEDSDLAGVKPTGDTTHFAESLAAAWDYQRQASAPGIAAAGAGLIAPGTPTAAFPAPTRAILLSDGNDLGSDDAVETARKLGVTLDTLAPGGADAERPARKVVLAGVQSPRRVLLGSQAQVLVTLRADGAVAGPLNLTLLENDKPIVSQRVSFDAGQIEQRVRLLYRPGEVGLRQYELQVKPASTPAPPAPPAPPVPPVPGPPAPSSAVTPPTYKFSARVIDNKKEVLILEDNWRWDFKFLRRVLEDDPSFSFTAMLSRGSGTYAQFGESDRRVQLGGFPQGRAELDWFDVIVLGDVNTRRWPAALARAIHDVVTEDGKSLVVIAGPNLAALAGNPDLAALLPVEVTRESAAPLEGSVEVQPSREGVASPFFFDASSLGSLPPLDRVYPPLRKRPAATILLETVKQANSYGNLIVMAEHTVGKGRVLYIGTDTLWKWQMSGTQSQAGVTPYGAFWQQALRALAPVQSHAGGVGLTLQGERSRYEAGHRVVLQARIQSDRALTAPTIESVVTLPDETQLPLSFSPDPATPGAYRAEFEPLTAGQYKIAATVNTSGKTAADVLTAIDVEEPRAELSGTGIDTANLARIAAGAGGRVINPADPATWPRGVKADGFMVRQDHHCDLWNNLTLLLVLSALLGADWLLRLVRGYV